MFPHISSKFSLLKRVKKIFESELSFLKNENTLLKSEILNLENKNRELSKQQSIYLISTEEKLVEAEYLIKKQNRQKNLLQFIGHDLKAPLQNITSFLNKENSPSSIEFIHKNATHGLDLINHLLSNKETTPKELKSEATYTFIPETVTPLIEQFGLSKYTNTIFKNRTDIIPVKKDGNISIFKQALSNLLSNINKYAIDPTKDLSSNQVNLIVDHGRNLGEICVQVQDSGKGVGDKNILQKPTKKTDKGHGIGLFQLKLHLEQIGGDIWLEKTKKGAHFKFQMPLLVENSDELLISPNSDSKQSRKEKNKISGLEKVKVLIIDDSPDIHQILGLYLEEISPEITIHSASNLREAITLESEFDYDICFLDMNVGEERGEHIFQQLIKIQKSTAVIGMSASFDDEKVTELKKIGFKSTMTKTFDEKLLAQLLFDL